MQDKDIITDVEFKEVPPEAAPDEQKIAFDPVKYLTTALANAGYHDPAGWAKGCDERAASAPEEKDRIFFVNRALRLYLAEIQDRENISPRMMLADGITSVQWAALIDQGIVPWLMNQFDKKGKRIQAEAPAVEAVSGEINSSSEESSNSEESLDEWRRRGELAGEADASPESATPVGATSDDPVPSSGEGVSGEVNATDETSNVSASDE